MDKPAIFALATATLTQSLSQSCDHDSIDPETGASHPYDVAATALKLWERFDQIKRIDNPITIFDWGFTFGLQLGAAVAEEPGRIPDINELTKSILFTIEESIFEQTKKERDAA